MNRKSLLLIHKPLALIKAKTMEEYLSGTQFEFELINALLSFAPRHMEECLKQTDLNYENYGTDNEIKLKQILKFYSNIRVVLRDIDLIFNFLAKDRSNILKHYPFLDSQETYFKYHYENYFIRIITILDLLGKLGTVLYGLDLNLEKVSAYTFKDKANQKGYDTITEIVTKITEKLNELKSERNKKLHTGETDIRPFNGIAIWEDLNANIGAETSEALKEYTDKKIRDEITNLRKSTLEIIDFIKEFLEESNIKLKEITTANNGS